jgi:hypothetical protein
VLETQELYHQARTGCSGDPRRPAGRFDSVHKRRRGPRTHLPSGFVSRAGSAIGEPSLVDRMTAGASMAMPAIGSVPIARCDNRPRGLMYGVSLAVILWSLLALVAIGTYSVLA